MKKITIMFIFILVLSFGVFADSYPTTGFDYNFAWSGGYVSSKYPMKFDYQDSNEYYVYYYTNGTYQLQYGGKLTGKTWVKNFVPSSSSITYSSYDILRADGSVFFSLPKPPPFLPATFAEVPIILPMNTLMTLVGVGISMISLMLLPDLLNRLYNYL